MTKNTKMLLTIGGVAVVGYLIWKRMQKPSSKEVAKSFTGNEEFFNLTASGGGTKVKYIAGGYDPNHLNSDGTRGATWISLGGSGSSGFWSTSIGLGQYVAQGTTVYPRLG